MLLYFSVFEPQYCFKKNWTVADAKVNWFSTVAADLFHDTYWSDIDELCTYP